MEQRIDWSWFGLFAHTNISHHDIFRAIVHNSLLSQDSKQALKWSILRKISPVFLHCSLNMTKVFLAAPWCQHTARSRCPQAAMVSASGPICSHPLWYHSITPIAKNYHFDELLECRHLYRKQKMPSVKALEKAGLFL